jgi:hypothetical protein
VTPLVALLLVYRQPRSLLPLTFPSSAPYPISNQQGFQLRGQLQRWRQIHQPQRERSRARIESSYPQHNTPKFLVTSGYQSPRSNRPTETSCLAPRTKRTQFQKGATDLGDLSELSVRNQIRCLRVVCLVVAISKTPAGSQF